MSRSVILAVALFLVGILLVLLVLAFLGVLAIVLVIVGAFVLVAIVAAIVVVGLVMIFALPYYAIRRRAETRPGSYTLEQMKER